MCTSIAPTADIAGMPSAHDIPLSDRALKAHEISVRIGHEELPDAGLSGFAHAVPPHLWFHEQNDARVADGRDDGVDVGNRDLEVHPASEWRDQFSSQPVPSRTALLEHEVRAPPLDVGESLFGPLVGDLESARAAPEPKARAQIGDEQLRDQIGFHLR